jgi:hypothetical protein
MNSADSAKDAPPQDQLATREIARRLINRRGVDQAGSRSAAQAAAAACDHLYWDLSRWVGLDGCQALFTRALTQARADHPVLEQIRLSTKSDRHLDGVSETIKTHGDGATAESVESVLVALIELLTRLIGNEMVTRLVEGSPPWSGEDAPTPAGRQEGPR